MKRRRIAVLMHERDRDRAEGNYLIGMLAKYWISDGHDVVFLFGTESSREADVLIVHVDLSVVPEEYVAFAKSYPVTINGRLLDIRKSTFSRQLLDRDADWAGPVIVKTDKNFGGAPERRLEGPAGGVNDMPNAEVTGGIEGPWDYRIYDSLQDVPEHTLSNPSLIVEKFQPEIEDGLYCLRLLNVLGSYVSSAKLRGRYPILNGSSADSVERIHVDDRMVRIKDELGCEYGKLDFVIADGEPVLLDVNKTVGVGTNLATSDRLQAVLREQAYGLYSYF